MCGCRKGNKGIALVCQFYDTSFIYPLIVLSPMVCVGSLYKSTPLLQLLILKEPAKVYILFTSTKKQPSINFNLSGV